MLRAIGEGESQFSSHIQLWWSQILNRGMNRVYSLHAVGSKQSQTIYNVVEQFITQHDSV